MSLLQYLVILAINLVIFIFYSASIMFKPLIGTKYVWVSFDEAHGSSNSHGRSWMLLKSSINMLTKFI